MPEDEGNNLNVIPDTAVVQRGDLYIPLATRFLNVEDRVERLEKKVTLLTWMLLIDIIVSFAGIGNNPIWGDLLKLLIKS